jgi:hypothetical protein
MVIAKVLKMQFESLLKSDGKHQAWAQKSQQLVASVFLEWVIQSQFGQLLQKA